MIRCAILHVIIAKNKGRLRVMLKSSVGKRTARQVALIEEGELIGCEGLHIC